MINSQPSSCLRKCLTYQKCAANLIYNKITFAGIARPLCSQTPYSHSKAGVHSERDGVLALRQNVWGKTGIHTSGNHQGKNLFKKFDMKTKKKHWHKTSFVPKQVDPSSHIGLSSATVRKQNQGESIRIQILNRLLFKTVSDLLSTPEVSSDVYNYGVEISKVSLSRDYSSCCVYWKTSGTYEKDSQIQHALDRCSPRIRYLLISHQIMGSVPPVVFIKDKAYAAVSEVENLLKVADFGERFEEESAERENQGAEDGGKCDRMSCSTENPGASKRSNLFGVDHEALTKQILEYKQKRSERQAPALPPASAGSLTQQQLDVLEELRRQKIIKKKKKSKRNVDDDITPKAYLLARFGEEEDGEEEDFAENCDDVLQVKEPQKRHKETLI